MKQSELVSRIRNGIKHLSKDTHISDRYILSIAKSVAKFLTTQQIDKRSLDNISSLYTTINCFEMTRENPIKCGVHEFKSCRELSVSKEKLPNLLYSRYGAAIASVTSVDNSKTFDKISLRGYTNNKDRDMFGVSKDRLVYYEQGGMIYIPDMDIKAINVTFLTMDKEDVSGLSGCDEDYDNCKSLWDYEFNCPDKLVEAVIKETLNEVLSTYARMIEDENPNLDSNIKSQTVK